MRAMEIRDRVVVVTGGASGIGEARARRFHTDGARHVIVGGLDPFGAHGDIAGLPEVEREVRLALGPPAGL